MRRVVVVANEPPWPVLNGGRSRVAGLVSALTATHDVTVLAGTLPGAAPSTARPPVPMTCLPASSTSRARSLLSRHPRLGARVLDRRGAAFAAAHIARVQPDVVVVSHSYLAPLLDLSGIVVLDLPNLEVDRPQQPRAVGWWEARKAGRWEPQAVRSAALCLAVDEADAGVARGWGAREVLVVPNASDARPAAPSPVSGPVLAVADWSYAPNFTGLQAFLREVWPPLRAARPDVELVLAGRGAPADLPAGVTARGFVHDLGALYDAAALVLAPATAGAGTQLKVLEAVARGRVVAMPEHGARSLPPGAAEHCVVGLDPGTIGALLDDVDERHRREAALRSLPTGWAAAAAPLTGWLSALQVTARG